MADNKDLDGKRYFLTSDGSKYFINPPNADDIKQADWTYAKNYSKCMIEGIATAAEMADALRKRGVIGPEYDRRLEDLTAELTTKIADLNSTDDLSEKQVLAREIGDLREEIFQWNQRVSAPMSNTCEQMSDDARTEFLTSRMVFKENGSLVWPKFEDYASDDDIALKFKSRYEVMLFLQGLPSDFLDNVPEQVALREVEAELLRKAESDMGEAPAVNLEEETPSVEDPKPVEEAPPKRTRKKKSTEDQ